MIVRPGGANEVVEAYRYIIRLRDQPAVLALSRQPVPTLDRSKYGSASGIAHGAYILADAPGVKPDLILIASGSEVSLAVEAYDQLLKDHIRARVVSMPASADGILPRRKLRTVIEYIMENLESSPTLAEMAASVHLSPYHFGCQFKAATGLPPHQYAIARRIERAQYLLRTDGELSLAEVALRAGFAHQGHFLFTSSGSLVSGRDSFEFPQASLKSTQARTWPHRNPPQQPRKAFGASDAAIRASDSVH